MDKRNRKKEKEKEKEKKKEEEEEEDTSSSTLRMRPPSSSVFPNEVTRIEEASNLHCSMALRNPVNAVLRTVINLGYNEATPLELVSLRAFE